MQWTSSHCRYGRTVVTSLHVAQVAIVDQDSVYLGRTTPWINYRTYWIGQLGQQSKNSNADLIVKEDNCNSENWYKDISQSKSQI